MANIECVSTQSNLALGGMFWPRVRFGFFIYKIELIFRILVIAKSRICIKNESKGNYKIIYRE